MSATLSLARVTGRYPQRAVALDPEKKTVRQRQSQTGLTAMHLLAGFDHVLEGAQPGARRADEHGHVAGAMLILPHAHMCFRNLLPGEYLAHARIDAALDHQLVGLARL